MPLKICGIEIENKVVTKVDMNELEKCLKDFGYKLIQPGDLIYTSVRRYASSEKKLTGNFEIILHYKYVTVFLSGYIPETSEKKKPIFVRCLVVRQNPVKILFNVLSEEEAGGVNELL